MNDDQNRPRARNHAFSCDCGFCQNIRRQEAQAQEKESQGLKPRRRLTVRRKRFVQEFSDPESPGFKNATQAAELAGYSKDSAEEIGNSLLRSEQVQRAIWVALDKAGITPDFLAQKHREGLEATETTFLKGPNGEIVEKVVPSYRERHKYLETAYKVRGVYPKEEVVQQAALVVQLPVRELTKGHGPFCRCEECERAWEEMAATKVSE